MAKYKSKSIVCTRKGIRRKTKRRPKQDTISKHGYEERNKSLKSLGYESYWHYLNGDIWPVVREMAFKEKGRTCISCQAYATQIHHASYDMRTLAGSDLTHLHPVCRSCHESAEFPDGVRSHKLQANRKLGIQGPSERREGRERRKYERQEEARSAFNRTTRSVRRAINKQFGPGRHGMSMRKLSRKYDLPMNTIRMILGKAVR